MLLVATVALGRIDGSGSSAALVSALLVAAVAWVVLRALWVGEQIVFRRLQIDVADNLRARSRRTQIELLRRVAAVVVLVGAAAVALLLLTPLGRIGPSLVAYAGLIGVVLGMALRGPLENLTAGIVIAVTEPIRIDDVVVVEEEWGRIEQIGLVNVVVHLWDDRRLVLPTARFVQEPFENWTKQTSKVTGTVTMWVDFSTDIEELRREIEQLADGSPHWDRRDCVVQVVELGEHAVQVRALVTAATAGDAWDLRCEVREQLAALPRRPRPLAPGGADGGARGVRPQPSPPRDPTAQTRTGPSTPFSDRSPLSSNDTCAEVRASSRTVPDTSTSPGADSLQMRAAMLTVPPWTLARPPESTSWITSPAWMPRCSGSPACSPAWPQAIAASMAWRAAR